MASDTPKHDYVANLLLVHVRQGSLDDIRWSEETRFELVPYKRQCPIQGGHPLNRPYYCLTHAAQKHVYPSVGVDSYCHCGLTLDIILQHDRALSAHGCLVEWSGSWVNRSYSPSRDAHLMSNATILNLSFRLLHSACPPVIRSL